MPLQVRCEEALEDGETPSSGLTWHLHLRDRLPLDLLALVPLMLRSVNKGAPVGGLVWGPR